MSTKRSQKRSQFFFLVALFLLCLIAAFLFWYTTPYGLGLTNDSAAYLGGARSLSAGLGYARISGDKLPRLITHFPPVYSLLISGLSQIARVDVFKAAWLINFFCYVLNLLLFAGLLRLLTGRNAAAILGGVCYFCAGPVLQSHIYGLSEAVFLTFFLLSLILILTNTQIERAGLRWFLTGLFIGILTLTRFIGGATLLVALAFILYVYPRGRQQRNALFAMLAGTGIPLALWILRNRLAGENAVNRTLSWHWPAQDKITEGFLNFWGFFLPEFGGLVEKLLPLWTALFLLILSAGVVWILQAFFRRFHKETKSIPDGLFLIALQALAYFLSVVFVVVCIDGSTLFDNRIFMPLYVSLTAVLLTGIFSLGWTVGKVGKRSKIRAVLTGFVLLFALVLFEDTFDLIRTWHRDGQGFAGESWRESETRHAAEALPDEAILFSNRQTFLWLMNDQPSYILPPMFNAANQNERDSFTAEKDWMTQETLKGKAYVIIFNYQEMMVDTGDRAWLELLLDDLPLYGTYTDGVIFGQ